YTTLTRKGDRYWGLCPFHSEKTASFSVTPEKNVFYCFGCHKGGSALTFLMEMEKLSFREAVELAAKKTGVEIRISESREGDLKRDALLELNERVSRTFSHLLATHEKGETARRYLDARHISPEIRDRFRLGYALPDPEWLYGFLRKKNYSDEFLSRSGLFRNDTRSYFRHRLIFPITNQRGEVVAFGGRALDDYGPKYLNSPETSFFHKGSNLYGIEHALPAIRENGVCHVVEGYTDVLALHASGVTSAVAPLGTALTETQVRLLSRYSNKAVLVFDSDEAGLKATFRAVELLERVGLESEVVELAGKKDPAEIFEKDGSQELKKVIQYSINSFHYLLKKAMTRFDGATPGGKEGVVAFIAPIVENVQSAIRRDAYIDMAADCMGVRLESLRRDLGRHATTGRKRTEEAPAAQSPPVSDELFFLLAVAVAGDAFPGVRREVRLEDLEDQAAKELYIALEECFRHDEDGIEKLAARVSDPEIGRLLFEKVSSDEFTLNREKLVSDGIRAVRQKSLERKKSEVVTKLRAYEKQTADFSVIRDLQLEIMYLDEELKKLRVREHGRDN
ncbi:MAG TPA: DNA primase, partial [Spirochaetia bacterium]|nr:DNA primase [Spirochaetia bacterium]